MRFTIEIAKRGAALDADGALRGIDMDGAHPRKVDDDAIVAKGTAADVVTSASDGGEQAVLAREVDGGDDVGESRAAGDERRPFVHARVPYATRSVVATCLWREQITLKCGSDRLNVQQKS